LVKGSRGMEMEEIVEKIIRKDRWLRKRKLK
jgi:hypothetical protein